MRKLFQHWGDELEYDDRIADAVNEKMQEISSKLKINRGMLEWVLLSIAPSTYFGRRVRDVKEEVKDKRLEEQFAVIIESLSNIGLVSLSFFQDKLLLGRKAYHYLLKYHLPYLRNNCKVDFNFVLKSIENTRKGAYSDILS